MYFYLVSDHISDSILGVFSRKYHAVEFVEKYIEKFNMEPQQMYIKRIKEQHSGIMGLNITIMEYDEITGD